MNKNIISVQEIEETKAKLIVIGASKEDIELFDALVNVVNTTGEKIDLRNRFIGGNI